LGGKPAAQQQLSTPLSIIYSFSLADNEKLRGTGKVLQGRSLWKKRSKRGPSEESRVILCRGKATAMMGRKARLADADRGGVA